jgi:hypothetical protein
LTLKNLYKIFFFIFYIIIKYLLLFVEKLLKGSRRVSLVTVPTPSELEEGRFKGGTLML